MASKFDEIVFGNQAPSTNPDPDPALLSAETDCSSSELDVTKRDRFELLSAYLDGEVTSAESRLVTTWLSEDPETQCLYRRLLTLRQAMRHMPVELTSSKPENQVPDTFFGQEGAGTLFKLECQWLRKVSLAVACTVATLLAGSLTNLIGSNTRPFQLTGFPDVPLFDGPHDTLELALDEPAIELTAPAQATPVTTDAATTTN